MLYELPALAVSVLLGQGLGGFMRSPLFPLILMFVVMYLLFWGPEKRKRSAVDQMQQELKKNDKIVTIGGIHGTVVNAAKDSDEVTIRVDENTRIRVSRNAIAMRASDETDTKKDD